MTSVVQRSNENHACPENRGIHVIELTWNPGQFSVVQWEAGDWFR
jgi:hypothetical protein